MKSIDFNCKKEIKEYVIGIKKLGIENFDGLYMEDSRYISKEVINYMEDEIGLKILSNKYSKVPYIPLVIKAIYNILNENLKSKEVLVISKNKEASKKIIKEIAKITQFITNSGCNLDDSEDVYEYILKETGLSLFTSPNVDKILGKYSIIVNLNDDFKLESMNINRNTIIFDLNREEYLECEKNINSRLYKIKDFGFDLEDLGVSKNKWLTSIVNMQLHDLIIGEIPVNVKYLYLGEDWYSIKNYVNSFIKLKGKL